MQADSALVTKIVPSPNLGPRKTDLRPSLLMLHYTGMESGVAALALLTNPLSEVSCHYIVWEDGRIFQLVPEAARAWHAGRGSWKGETDINSHSIGIEIVNGGQSYGLPPYPSMQCAGPFRYRAHAQGRSGRAFPVADFGSIGHWSLACV